MSQQFHVHSQRSVQVSGSNRCWMVSQEDLIGSKGSLTLRNVVHHIHRLLWNCLIIEPIEKDVQPSFGVIHNSLDVRLCSTQSVFDIVHDCEDTYRNTRLLHPCKFSGENLIYGL